MTSDNNQDYKAKITELLELTDDWGTMTTPVVAGIALGVRSVALELANLQPPAPRAGELEALRELALELDRDQQLTAADKLRVVIAGLTPALAEATLTTER